MEKTQYSNKNLCVSLVPLRFSGKKYYSHKGTKTQRCHKDEIAM